jgi:AraC family ethanolamine operon transcriptional activator
MDLTFADPADLADSSRSACDGLLFSATSRDADVQAALLRGWNQSYAQISPGEFSGGITEACFGDVRLFTEFTNRALLQSGVLPEDLVAVGIPVQMSGTAVFCGAAAECAAVHFFSGSGGFDFYSPAGLLIGGVAVPRSALLAVLQEEEMALVEPCLDRAHLANPAQEELESMRDFLQGALSMTGSSPLLAQNARLREVLQQTILSNLAQLLLACCERPVPVMSLANRWKIVADAREVVLRTPDAPSNVSDICAAVGVSRRTLQYCFQNVLGLSPTAFLRAMRLDGVRRMLRTASSVTDAAVHWGFWHFGYFSQDYRKLFGELPSQTHRRYHAAVEVPSPRSSVKIANVV